MVQNWYCEYEECGACINESRHQCAGCGGWFCVLYARPLFLGSFFWICETCRVIWSRLREAEEQAFYPRCHAVREDADCWLCRACSRLLSQVKPWGWE